MNTQLDSAKSNPLGPDRTVKLSICIATFRRSDMVGETLDSVVSQLPENVEIVVVDGASPDNTDKVVGGYLGGGQCVRYVREVVNSGVDRDFDKAVGYARGEYCWLMSDDDLLAPGAVQAVLNALEASPDLVVVNAQLWNSNMTVQLQQRMLPSDTPTEYSGQEADKFMSTVGKYLTFIGAVVIRRSVWLERVREPYMGTLFIHAGVLFQSPPLTRIVVLTEPWIRIRYGNAMWTSRAFEIWMFKWPKLVWSFATYSASARNKVTPPAHAPGLAKLCWYRGIGVFGGAELRALLAEPLSLLSRVMARVVNTVPPSWMNTALAIYCCVPPSQVKRMYFFDLSRAACSSAFTRRLARWQNIPAL